jgi:hypothetical protein
LEFDTQVIKEETNDGLETIKEYENNFDTREFKAETLIAAAVKAELNETNKIHSTNQDLHTTVIKAKFNKMNHEPVAAEIKADINDTTTTSVCTFGAISIGSDENIAENIAVTKNSIHSFDMSIMKEAVDAMLSFETPLTQADVDSLNISIGTDLIEDTMNYTTETVVSIIGVHSLKYYDLRKLREGIWLNDEIVNWWMYILLQYDNNKHTTHHTHYFSSFFVQQLFTSQGEYCFSNVKRWSKKVFGNDIFQLEHVFFPINITNTHWVAVIAHIQERRLEYYDSMRAINPKFYLNLIFNYLKDEHKATKGGLELEHQNLWQLEDCSLFCPKQNNDYDCGVFVCTFAYHLATNKRYTFTNDYVSVIRKKMGRLAITMSKMNFITNVNDRNTAELIIVSLKNTTIPPFPLHLIGPLVKPTDVETPPVATVETTVQTSTSSLCSSFRTQLNETGSLCSYEFSPGYYSDDRSFLSESFNSKKDADQYHNAIVGALSWLYSVREKTERYGLTQTIVNAITYLPRYYAVALRYADNVGSNLTIAVDWARVPIVNDSGYYPKELPAKIPTSVRHILKLNNYYDRLPTILIERTQEATLQRHSNARNFPPCIIYTCRDENSPVQSDAQIDSDTIKCPTEGTSVVNDERKF